MAEIYCHIVVIADTGQPPLVKSRRLPFILCNII